MKTIVDLIWFWSIFFNIVFALIALKTGDKKHLTIMWCCNVIMWAAIGLKCLV